jgi:hypothetical protein
MLVEDVWDTTSMSYVSRLSATKYLLSGMIEELSSSDSSVGLAVFAGDAFLSLPFTQDWQTINYYID